MIYNQPLIEITKQGAVAVEEIKFSPPKLQSLINSIQNGGSPLINKNGSPAANALKNKQILQLQGHGIVQQQAQQQQQSNIFSLNSLNPYYAQQVYCQFQKPHNFIKQVHVVVKNTPFGITMKSNDPQFNFHNYVIKATLLYDSDPPKMVDFIHNEPLQYVATVNEDGSEVVVDVKVGILSSQHQGAMFLAVLHISHSSVPVPSPNEPIMTILNNIGNNSIQNLNQSSHPIYNLCVVSHPIRIVSKVDHVKKEGIPILKKKTFHEILTDKLKKLQKFQDGQNKWIKNLYQQHLIEFDMEPYCSKKYSCDENSSNSSTPSLNSYSKFNNNNNNTHDISSSDDEEDDDTDNNNDDDIDNDFSISKQQSQKTAALNILNNNIKQQQHIQQQLLIHQNQQRQANINVPLQSQQKQSNNFQNSFNRVVESFKYVPENERKEVIAKMVEQLRSDDLEQLVSTFMDELGVSNSDNNSEISSICSVKINNASASEGCFCENCPSKRELERFQGLCMNFFVPQGPVSSNPIMSSLFANDLTQSQINNSISINHNNNNHYNHNNNHHHHHHNHNYSNNSNSNLTNDLLQLPII